MGKPQMHSLSQRIMRILSCIIPQARQKQSLVGQLKEYFKLYNFHSQYANKTEHIRSLGQIFAENFRNVLEKKQGEIERVKMLIDVACERKLTHAQMECERIFEALKVSNPRSLCKNGYAQINKEQKVCVLQDIALYLHDTFQARVL